MNFDPVASYYDQLARFVFGKSIFDAQTTHFRKINKDSKVLIVGGGTGWILEKLPASCVEVTFVEPSGEMIKKAGKRKIKVPVQFIQKPIQKTKLNDVYDVIITNFFFDLFDELEGYEIALNLKDLLKKNGIWILTDFEKGEWWWQRIMLDLMYFFFAQSTGMQNRHLPVWRDIMFKIEMEPQDTNVYFGKFISSVRYQTRSSSV